GDGDYRANIQKMIDKYSLSNDFILLGFKDNTLPFIEACDIFVHPSRFEGKSNSVDEAKFACKPIVVTNYPTVNEQITHMHNGIVVEMTPKSLANGIIQMGRNGNLKNSLVANLKHEKASMVNSISSF